MKVLTTKGLIDSAELDVRDVVSFDDNSRTIAVEWYLGDEMVRRDVWVNLLRGLEVNISGG